MLERVPKYTLRKLSVGLASVMIGSGILMNSPKVLADTINPNEGTSTAVQPSSQDKDNSEPSTQSVLLKIKTLILKQLFKRATQLLKQQMS